MNNTQHKNTPTAISTSDQFISLFEKDRNRLYAYIYAYVTDKAAADDIFQETSMTLWREFQTFELGTNFSKWANGIAFNRVRVYRRNNKKFVLGLSEELMESITNNIAIDVSSCELHFQAKQLGIINNSIDNNVSIEESTLDNRWNALQSCRSLLREADQQLYEFFYVNNMKAQELADQTGRSIYAIRKSIHKLRKKLFDCVERKRHKDPL